MKAWLFEVLNFMQLIGESMVVLQALLSEQSLPLDRAAYRPETV
jgi:hypothetical protein